MHKRDSQEMSVKDFLREVVFCEKENLQVNPQPSAASFAYW